MNFDELVKYLIWIVFFVIAIGGIYFFLSKLGVA